MGVESGNPFIDAIAGWRFVDPFVNISFDDSGAGGAWAGYEIQAFTDAFQTWANVAAINWGFGSKPGGSNIVERLENSAFFADDTSDGSDVLGEHAVPNAGNEGHFNAELDEWSRAGLVPGGNAFATLVHEIGHAIGLAHPFDTLMRTGIFPGLSTNPDIAVDQLGDNSFNQALYTVMAYNEPTAPNSYRYGHYAGPMAFDIAAIQVLYGANRNFRGGDDVYVLPDKNGAGTFYSCIWDTGGTDEITYGGNRDATIDLRSATLRNQVGGGGYLSSAKDIKGGFTIAPDYTSAIANRGYEDGVIIENATGGGGNDTITGNTVANRLAGRGGNDFITGSYGDDILDGGAGIDDLRGGSDNDTLSGGAGEDKLYGSSGADTLSGGDDADILSGGEGNDALNGDDGADTLDGGSGYDTLRGGTGDDTYYVLDSTLMRTGVGSLIIDRVDRVIEDVNAGTDIVYVSTDLASVLTVSGYLGAYTLPDNVENGELRGARDFNLYGNSVNNLLLANDAVNVLEGAGGNDILKSYGGNDTLRGGDGDDLMNGGSGRDWLEGGAGNDDYALYDVSFLWIGNFPIGEVYDTVVEAADGGRDSVHVMAQPSFFLAGGMTSFYRLDANIENGFVEGSDPFDIEGNELNNAIFGNDAANALGGGSAGDDTLDGRGGADWLAGGIGKDWLVGGEGGDTIDGGEGNDTASYDWSFDSVYVFLAAEWLNSGGDAFGDTLISVENLSGSIYGDLLSGDENDNILNGNDGGDYLAAAGGRDRLNGGEGDDVLASGTGADAMDGGNGVDTATYELALAAVTASLSNASRNKGEATGDTYLSVENLLGSGDGDRLIGNAGANTLNGAGDNDVLAGGRGSDQLFGGSGNDRFDFDALADSGISFATRDVVLDFEHGADVIDLRGIDARTGGGDNRFTFIGAAAFHDMKGELRYQASGGSVFVEADVNGDGKADFSLRIAGVASLSASDFAL